MNLHIEFLRPAWFLAIIPVIWLLYRAWRLSDPKGRWQRVIAPEFQSLLLGNDSASQGLNARRMAVIGLAALWTMSIIALAGPSLKSVKLPAQKSQQGVVIVLDLSLSMLADDLKPNRLSRVRFKLIDLLKIHPEQAFGMVAYSGSAHTIAPISEDNQTLLSLIPTLTPLMMPSYGSDPLNAFEQADTLFKGAHITQGHLIWVTDDLESTQSAELASWVKKSGYTLSILAVGTPQGGAVNLPNYGLLKNDQGAIVLPKLPYETLRQFSLGTGAALAPIAVDDSDLAHLLPGLLGSALAENAHQKTDEKAVLHPLDDGSAILLALLLPFALAFRRGWLLSVALLLTLPLTTLYAPPSLAKTELPDITDVFQTPDQQGYKSWQKKDYAAAEVLFENTQWKGSALYQNGKYKEAAEQFKKDPSPNGLYNLGNALAQQGKLVEAKEAYEKALKQQPDMQDAKDNLNLINRLLEQQKSSSPDHEKQPGEKQPNATPNTDQSKPNQGASNKRQQEQKERNGAQASDKGNQQTDRGESSSETQQAGSDKNNHAPSQTKHQTEENKQETDSADQIQKSGRSSKPKDNKPSAAAESDRQTDQPEAGTLAEQKRATQNWLQQIPDEPGLFLKRKFQYQFDNAARKPAQTDPTQSQAGKKIW